MKIKPVMPILPNKSFNAFGKKYKQLKPMLKKTQLELEKKVLELIKIHKKDAKLRIAYVDSRIKDTHSIIRKACSKGIAAADIFKKIYDIVGLRIVVNNLKDVSPLIDQLIKIKGLKIKQHNKCNYRNGYKAKHLKAIYHLTYNGKRYEIKCEIQIKSLLQDAWANLTHHDVYKNTAKLPELANSISRNISKLLGNIDQMADEFRREIEAKVVSPNDLSDDAALNRDGIAFLYYELFGESPQEYEVESLLKVSSKLQLENIGHARKGLTKKVFQKLLGIYKEYFWFDISNTELFEYGLIFSVKGEKTFNLYRKKVQSESHEIEEIARREILSEMPDTIDDFIDDVNYGNIPWHALIELGAIEHCELCASEMIDPYNAVEAVLNHYDQYDDEERLYSIFDNFISSYGLDYSSDDCPGLCQHCCVRSLED